MIGTGALAFLAAALLAQGHHAASSARKSTAASGARSTSSSSKRAPAPRHSEESANTTTADASTSNAESSSDEKSEGGTKAAKTRTYTFGAMDVEGKMKTPQLLYFLNRVKLELEMSAPDKKSFMPELEQSAHDSSL